MLTFKFIKRIAAMNLYYDNLPKGQTEISQAEHGLFEKITDGMNLDIRHRNTALLKKRCDEIEQRLAEAERLIAAKDKGLLAACTAMRLNGMHRVPAYLDAEEAHFLSLTAPQQEQDHG